MPEENKGQFMENKVSDFIDTMIETNQLFRFNLCVEAPLKTMNEFKSLFMTHHKSFLPPEIYREKNQEYIDSLSYPFYWHYRILLGLKESKKKIIVPKASNDSRPYLRVVS